MQVDDWVLCKIYQLKREKENPKIEEVNKDEAATPTEEVTTPRPQDHPNQINYEAQQHGQIDVSSCVIIEQPFPIPSLYQLPSLPPLPPSLSMPPLDENLSTLPPFPNSFPPNDELVNSLSMALFDQNSTLPPLPSFSIPSLECYLLNMYHHNPSLLNELLIPSLSMPSLEQNTTLTSPTLLSIPPLNQNLTPPPPPLPPPHPPCPSSSTIGIRRFMPS